MECAPHKKNGRATVRFWRAKIERLRLAVQMSPRPNHDMRIPAPTSVCATLFCLSAAYMIKNSQPDIFQMLFFVRRFFSLQESNIETSVIEVEATLASLAMARSRYPARSPCGGASRAGGGSTTARPRHAGRGFDIKRS
jgi:hypothetical protein